MSWIITKYLITAGVVVLVSELELERVFIERSRGTSISVDWLDSFST